MAVVEVDVSGVPRKVRAIKGDTALGLFAAETARAGMDPYVPFRSGYLCRTAGTEPWAVSYSTPYAAYVYYGRGIQHYTEHPHPYAGREWDRAYMAGHPRQLALAITSYLKEKR